MRLFFLTLLLIISFFGKSQSRFINMADSLTMDSTINVGARINEVITNVGAGSSLYFGTATYLINTSVVVNKQLQIYGTFATFKTTANITILDITVQFVNVNNIIFRGDGKSSGKTSQLGVRFLNGKNVITGCKSLDIAGEAYRLQFSAAPSHGIQISYPFIQECNIGINAFPNFAGEYVNVDNANIGKCKTGVKLGAGNFLFDNGHVDYCDTAFSMVPSANDGHGTISNTSMNHCIRGFSSSGTLLGMNIIGCDMYSSNVYIKNSKGIVFQNSFFRNLTFNIDNSSGSFINNIVDTYEIVEGFAAPFTIVWTNPSTCSFSFINVTELTGPTPALITRTVNDTLIEIDGDILANGAISITLPPAYKKFNQTFTITNISATEVATIVGTISGIVNPTLNSQYSYITIYSDGVNYYVKSIQNGRVSGVTPRRVLINK